MWERITNLDYLWVGETTATSTAFSGVIQLSRAISSIYDKLGFRFKFVNSSTGETRIYHREITVDTYIDFINNAPLTDKDRLSFCWGFYNFSDYFDILVGSSLTEIKFQSAYTSLVSVVGIKTK